MRSGNFKSVLIPTLGFLCFISKKMALAGFWKNNLSSSGNLCALLSARVGLGFHIRREKELFLRIKEGGKTISGSNNLHVELIYIRK